MYFSLLLLHSWLRWVVLMAGAIALVRAWAGWSGKRPWTPSDDRAGRWLAVSLDVQFLIGLVLYAALSPFTRMAFQDFGAAMRDSALRYWAVEHLFGMVVALVLVHVGRARIRKARFDDRRFRLAAIFFTLAMLAILLSIPWPFMPQGRPWIRF